MGATSTTPAVSTGDVLTATNFNLLPRGCVYYNRVTANQAGITTTADITSMTAATWTASSSRLYRTTIYLPSVYVTATGGYVWGYITDGSSTQLAGSNIYIANTARDCMIVQHIESGLSGSVTRKGRFNGNGATVTLEMSSTAAGFIMVEDLSAA